MQNPRICGFCYTQLTDIEQEQNGLYRYDRSRKFSDKVYDGIRRVNEQTAAVERSENPINAGKTLSGPDGRE